MSALPGWGADRVLGALSWPEAVAALRSALASGLDPEAEPARTSTPLGSGELLMMPSGGGELAGVKLVTVAPGNPARGLPRIHGIYVLFDAATLAPVATLDGAALTAVRTPAVSALGVDLVAPHEAHGLVVFGTGPQAYAHVHALRAVRPVRAVTVVGPDPERAQRLVDRLCSEDVPAAVGDAASVAGADLVACCTTSREPLFDGASLAEHAVVVAIGSHEPSAREVDSETVRRCGVLVESRAAALAEAGDVMLAVADGAVAAGDVVPMADVVTSRTARRPRLIKTVGMGWEDLVVASAVVGASREPTERRGP